MDDKFNLKPTRQLIFPLLAIAVVLAAGIKITYVGNPFGGILAFGFIGIFLGPVVLALALSLIETWSKPAITLDATTTETAP